MTDVCMYHHYTHNVTARVLVVLLFCHEMSAAVLHAWDCDAAAGGASSVLHLSQFDIVVFPVPASAVVFMYY